MKDDDNIDKVMTDLIARRVDEALTIYPSDGLRQYLKPLVLEGYRSDIADALIKVLTDSDSDDKKCDALELLYYLYGAGQGVFFSPIGKNPRPEEPDRNELLTANQLYRLVSLALKEVDSMVIEDYAALFNCLFPTAGFSKDVQSLLIDFCLKGIRSENENTAQRCQSILEKAKS